MTQQREDARVGALLLAAGSSTRMGKNKMLMEINGETVLRRAAKTAVEAGLNPVVVVTGHESNKPNCSSTGLAAQRHSMSTTRMASRVQFELVLTHYQTKSMPC